MADIGKGDWQEAAISGGRHLERMLEMYRELGWEVRLEEVSADDCVECTACYETESEPIYRVYIRPKQGAAE